MKLLRKILQRTTLILAVAVLLLDPVYVQAQAVDLKFFSKNDILFWNPNDCNAGGSSGGTANLVGNENAEKIWNYLVGNDGNLSAGQRLSAEQAAGVMGNIYEETLPKFDPASEEGGGGGGYGIVQWTGGRRDALEKAARDAGAKVSDLGFQLTFMFQESNGRQVTARDFKSKAIDNNEWKTLQSLKSVEDAALFWHQNFEISADGLSAIQERVKAGKDVYASFKDKVPADGAAGPAASTGCSAFNGGDLKETLLAYAWPDRRNNQTPNAEIPTDAYKKAIEKAQKEGQYVGGPPPGIDCGGFITRLMIDSGYEPNYNYGGKESAGASNTDAQENWLKENWEFLGSGSTIDVATLQLGDVAVKKGSGANGHTFLYVGQIDGFDSDTASASLGQRAPTAAFETPTDGEFNWYRKK